MRWGSNFALALISSTASWGNVAQLCLGLAHRDFYPQPGLKFVIVGPEIAHFGQGIAFNQGLWSEYNRPILPGWFTLSGKTQQTLT
jgi:hypothetical protein